MHKAYIILAHQYPQQLERLVNQLNDGKSFFFIHIDASVGNPSDFKKALAGFGTSVIYLKRFASSWAGYGLVEATLEGLRVIAAHETPFDFITLLSGQDYPVKKAAEYHKFLETNKDKSFIHYFPLPYKGWFNGGLDRVRLYYFGNRRTPDFFSRLLMGVMNYLAAKSRLFQKQLPAGMSFYGGSQWWTLNREAMLFVLSFTNQQKRVVQLFKTSLIPDEIFFQTILLNAGLFNKQLQIENNSLRMILFKNEQGENAAVLDANDYESIRNSGAFFARKMHPVTSESLLTRIDAENYN